MNRRNALAASILLTCIAWALTASSTALAGEVVDPSTGKAAEDGKLLYYDIRPLGVEGQGWSGADLESPFDRLPKKAKGVVREPVWNLGRHSAGLAVRFETDATAIRARWTLVNQRLDMAHMPATGVSGLDLYFRDGNGKWRWLAVGKPAAPMNDLALVSALPSGKREYMLYLPLYNGVTSVEIGIAAGAKLFKADPRPADKSKPIVFYGTSIMQGGCASRPGMCHAAILGRRLDRPVINLGFSGNGRMEPEVAALLAELDPAVFVIDCLPNMNRGMKIEDRTKDLVKTIRAKHPQTPILLVEDRTYADAALLAARQKSNRENREDFRKAYDALVAAGDKQLGYIDGETLLDKNGEDTVDGSHPTDLGFVHQADAMQPALEKLLSGK
jgi:hypothetical protein